ncbi:dienelactone hydrolase family protein, partial [Klebsiella pneumoniae]|uniref:dienelactone hydrolase family protein n=1 Tax=Klebsiella pneumoniae TaxID=573 RepID=UPI0030139AF0
AEVKTKEITFKSGSEDIKGFLAEPEGKGPFPAVVVIQEWWGLTDWIKENAKHFATQGYVALAPDLYRGKVTDDPKVA